MRNRVKTSGGFAGIHRTRSVDYIRDSTSRKLNLRESLIVEEAGDVEIEISLVSFESRLKKRVEEIGEIRRRGNVAEVFEVSFEVREAIDAISRAAAFEFLELVPSTFGVIVEPRGN